MTTEEHLWSTLQLILYNACKLHGELVITRGAFKKHTFHPSFKQRGIFVEHFEETQASRGLLFYMYLFKENTM